MKSLTLNYTNCIYDKYFQNGLKEKTLLSTKMEKMCKKNITNKVNEDSSFTDLPFQEKQKVKEIQLFGTKISRLYSHFVLVGEEKVICGTKALISFKNHAMNGKENVEIKIEFDEVSSENAEKLDVILKAENLDKTFFNFVLTDESDVATLSLFSLTIARLKEVLKENFFVNIAVTTRENSNLWKFCAENKINTLSFPHNIDEKNCTLSPVGLFPMAVQNIDLEKTLFGAKQMLENFKQEKAENSLSFATALIIYNFYKLKKRQIVLGTREFTLKKFIKHFQNLTQFSDFFGGKKVNMFLSYSKQKTNSKLEKLKEDLFLPKSFQELDDLLVFATKQTLWENGVPNFSLVINERADETMGQLLFFFELTALIMKEIFGIKDKDDFEKNKNEKVRKILSSKKIFKREEKESLKFKI